METVNLISNALRDLGIKRGDTVLMHSSLKALGGEASPSQVIEALIGVLGDEGTLVMPALSYLHCNKNNRFFDYYITPSNVGAIAEFFRTQTTEVVRSLNPTHSCCALGANADFVTSGHVLDTTPCGKNSPFVKVRELGGKVLFLGCGMRPNTSMHAIEELFEPNYLFGETYEYRMQDRGGDSFICMCKAHDFTGVSQRYDRLEELLEAGTELKKGYVNKALCHLVEAEAMWVKASAAFLKNSNFFISFN